MIQTKKDAFGVDVSVGDRVVYIEDRYRGAKLQEAVVTKLSDRFITVKSSSLSVNKEAQKVMKIVSTPAGPQIPAELPVTL